MPSFASTTPREELDQRIRRFQRYLSQQQIGGALIMQNTDLFYFAGTIQQSHLYIPVEGKPVLMARKSLARARAESTLDHIVPLTSPKHIADLLGDAGLTLPV